MKNRAMMTTDLFVILRPQINAPGNTYFLASKDQFLSVVVKKEDRAKFLSYKIASLLTSKYSLVVYFFVVGLILDSLFLTIRHI